MSKRFIITATKEIRVDMVMTGADAFEAAEKLREFLPGQSEQPPGVTEGLWIITDAKEV